MLRVITAGESHGEALLAIVEGLPAGLRVREEDINYELERRQKGYGRGARMRIESDKVKILSGVRWGETIGSPVGLMIINKDYRNYSKLMSKLSKDLDLKQIIHKPRPGHADLVGMQKYMRTDVRDILERASARETAIRVAVGALAKMLLNEYGIKVYSHVIQIGKVETKRELDYKHIKWAVIEKSPLRCADKKAEQKMISLIKNALKTGDTLGGVFQIVVTGCPAGLGSHVSSDRKLDARISKSLISIQAVKGVEFGDGFSLASTPGSKAHDEIYYNKLKGFYRLTNRCGGFEGGITNGSELVIQVIMKPIASLNNPLRTVDLKNLSVTKAEIVRSDVCAVPAAGVIGESAVSWEIARALKEKFGGDSIKEMKSNFNNYEKMVKRLDFLPKH
ncbi:MAG: chorismate synthase [bacterium]